jgi:hypothetical protein
MLGIEDVGYVYEIGVADVLDAVFLSVEAVVEIAGADFRRDAVIVHAAFAAQNEIAFVVAHMFVHAYGGARRQHGFGEKASRAVGALLVHVVIKNNLPLAAPEVLVYVLFQFMALLDHDAGALWVRVKKRPRGRR